MVITGWQNMRRESSSRAVKEDKTMPISHTPQASLPAPGLLPWWSVNGNWKEMGGGILRKEGPQIFQTCPHDMSKLLCHSSSQAGESVIWGYCQVKTVIKTKACWLLIFNPQDCVVSA